jgi:replicative DNA helicase
VSAVLRSAHGDVPHLRVPPQSIQAEQEVLGAVMLDNRALGRIRLDAADFYRRDHQLIFQAICDLDAEGKPYDVVTLGEWFEEQGRAEQVGNGTYLFELVSTQGSAANVVAYAQIVRKHAILRRAIDVATELVNDGYQSEGREPAEILDTAIRELMALTKSEARHDHSMKQAVTLAWQDAQEAHEHQGSIRGVPTGYDRIDKRLGGWHRGDLVILGARPSMGKTALMVNLALNAASQKHGVGLISGEQSAMQIGQRSVSAESHVPAERMRNGAFEDEDWPRMTEAMRRLIERRVRIYDRSAPTLEEVCRTARQWKQEHGISVLFVDYLQRIRVPRAENRIAEVAETARGLKTLARDLEIPVIALAQVKADVDTRAGDKRPGLGDVANSDEATREADLIGFLFRPVVYDENASPHAAELNFEKNRHGPTGRFRLHFDGKTMRFTDHGADS